MSPRISGRQFGLRLLNLGKVRCFLAGTRAAKRVLRPSCAETAAARINNQIYGNHAASFTTLPIDPRPGGPESDHYLNISFNFPKKPFFSFGFSAGGGGSLGSEGFDGRRRRRHLGTTVLPALIGNRRLRMSSRRIGRLPALELFPSPQPASRLRHATGTFQPAEFRKRNIPAVRSGML